LSEGGRPKTQLLENPVLDRPALASQGIDKNLAHQARTLGGPKRRHLNESQRATVAARLANTLHGGDRRSNQAANLPVVSQPSAAAMLNVSERTVRDAVKVKTDAQPEIVAAVELGKLALSVSSFVAPAQSGLWLPNYRVGLWREARRLRLVAKASRLHLHTCQQFDVTKSDVLWLSASLARAR
jgi:hypothetical protein